MSFFSSFIFFVYVQIAAGAVALSPTNGLGPLLADAAALVAGGAGGGGAHASEAPLARHAALHAASHAAPAHAAHHVPWELRPGIVEVSQLVLAAASVLVLAAYCVFVLKMLVIQLLLIAHGRTYIEHRCCEGVMLGCTYDHGPLQNWVGLFGTNWWLWWSPLARPAHGALAFFPSKPPPASERASSGGEPLKPSDGPGLLNWIMKRI